MGTRGTGELLGDPTPVWPLLQLRRLRSGSDQRVSRIALGGVGVKEGGAR